LERPTGTPGELRVGRHDPPRRPRRVLPRAGLNNASLLSFAAGNFIYIAASDLIPEVKHETDARKSLIHFDAFASGVGLIIMARKLFGD